MTQRKRRWSYPGKAVFVIAAAVLSLQLMLAAALMYIASNSTTKLLLGHGDTQQIQGLAHDDDGDEEEEVEQLDIEVWARGPSHKAGVQSSPVHILLTPEEQQQLAQLCGRCLYHSLQNVVHGRVMGHMTFVATGDLPLMWIRDSAVQLGVLLPRMAQRPALRALVDGGIRAQAFFITQDPYANGFGSHWVHPAALNKMDRVMGRGGWVGVRNYEADSGAYYLNLLWKYYRTPGLYRPQALLEEAVVFEAARLVVQTWVAEQRHEELSKYRYSELPRGGLGSPVGYTGMSWSAFRPSDDPTTYGYSIPTNMYLVGALERALRLNKRVWKSKEFDLMASKLLSEIRQGILKYGLVKTSDGELMYAYEVDGLGGNLTAFDDPNLPSLVGMPLLGFRGYDEGAYWRARGRILSPTHNRYYFMGKYFRGLGSPHTTVGLVWALGIAAEALTAPTPIQQAQALRTLLLMQCGTGLMHESVHADDLMKCTRRWFEWANALAVTVIEQLLGLDCDEAAEHAYRISIQAREQKDNSTLLPNQVADDPLFYQDFTSTVQYDGQFDMKVQEWPGSGHFVHINSSRRWD